MKNIWKKVLNLFNNPKQHYIGLDLGTSHISIYVSGQGIICNEASIIAYDLLSDKKKLLL